jgi:hypothetical protein
MRMDERMPLSRAKLQEQILRDEKYAVVSAVVPILFVTLLAVGFTTATVTFCAVSPLLLWVFLIIGALPFWFGDAILLYRAWKAFRRYREDIGRDFVTIGTDTVSELTEESELHRSGNTAYQDKAYVVYLAGHGRCVIGSTLWHILKEGDDVYVAVLNRPRPVVYRVYSKETHRLIQP